MLIEEYDLEVFTPPCEPGAEKWSAIARLKVDISEVLPYLNATLRGAVYNHAARALTWKKGGRNTAFHPYEIAASNLEDRTEAERVVKGLIKTVNRTWEAGRD
jgi:ArsR family metal-binding transcriptional regulator